MGRIKNKPTVIRFLAICVAGFCLLMLLGTTVLITYTTHRAAQDSMRKLLSKEARHIGWQLTMDEAGNIKVPEDFHTENQNCIYAVYTGGGEILTSSFSAELQPLQDQPPGHHYRTVSAAGGTYGCYDHWVRTVKDASGAEVHSTLQENEPQLIVRTAIDVRQVDSVYRSIQRLYYGFVVLLLCLLGAGSVLLYRWAARPVREMCDSAARIMEHADFSERIENTGPFYETEVMTDAYNRLIDRTEGLALQQEEFNENVSHELRTPVALIRSECELVEDLYPEGIPPEVAEAIEVIHRQSDRMNAMIAELLYLSRINRDTYELQKETIDLVDLAESACEDAEDLMHGQWAFAYDLQPAQARIDVALVMIAVRNLISNAMKYSPQGSRIEIATGVEEDFAFLRVRDAGIGIAEENLEKIFEPYYQVKGERNSDGFGLGLSLVQKVAEKHWGCISVESRLGEGSTFTLRLPVDDQPLYTGYK